MSVRATQLDVSVLTVNAVDYTPLVSTVSLTKNVATAEGQAISRKYNNPQAVKNSWSLAFTARNTKTAPFRVTNLDLTGHSIGGSAFVADTESLTINVNAVHAMGDACQDGHAYPVYTGSTIDGSAVLKVPTTSVPLMAALDAPGDADLAFTFTLNGVQVTFPVIITSVAHNASVGQVQMVNVSFVGQDPLTGNHPSAPTGTTTILEKVLNAPQTAIPIAFTSKASGGVAYTGNALIQSYSVNISNSAVVEESMTWAGVGAPTDAATA
jgi:hypothetical protein